MRFDATSGGRTARVEVRAKGAGYTVLLDGRALEVEVERVDGPWWTVLVDGRRLEAGVLRRPEGWLVDVGSGARDVAVEDAASAGAGPRPRVSAGPAKVAAPMPGRIVRVLVAKGDAVRAGQGLVVMEAMKMENEIRAPRDGRVREVAVAERQAVETGALLASLEPLETADPEP
jgi:biotin carboxyl carrier protein